MEPLFVVQLNVDKDVEDRWNEWYNTVHVPEVMSLSDEITEATRYRRTNGDVEYEYMAIYRFASEEALATFLQHPHLAEMGEDYLREWGEHSSRVRGFWEPILQKTRTP
jgi:hypothetical protein